MPRSFCISLGLVSICFVSSALADDGIVTLGEHIARRPLPSIHERYWSFKYQWQTADTYYIQPTLRCNRCPQVQRPRVEYSPTVIPASGQVHNLAAAYARPPAILYGPAVAAPGPGVPVYGPDDQALDPSTPVDLHPFQGQRGYPTFNYPVLDHVHH